MKSAQKLALALVFILASVLTAVATESPSEAKPPTSHQKIYAFEHRVMPRWTHQTKGAFYEDMRKGLPVRLVDAAREIAGDEFANHIKVSNVATPEGVLVAFHEPEDAPLCFFVFIMKTEEGFRYLTLEKSIDITGDGTTSALCEWSYDGRHMNFGPRTYTDSKKFLVDIAILAQRAEKAAPGRIPPLLKP